MAGDLNASNSRYSRKNNSPNTTPLDSQTLFLTDETEFIGKGNTPSSRKKQRRSRSRSGHRTSVALSLSDESFYEDLEDYVKEMSTSRDTTANSGDQDVWTQLQQKESDLLLAAELGKALLEKNEELKKEQERLAEDYSKKLEVSN